MYQSYYYYRKIYDEKEIAMEIYTYSVLVPEQHINHFFNLFKKAEENGILFDLELKDNNIIFKQEDQPEADIEHILYSSGTFEEDELDAFEIYDYEVKKVE